MSKLLVRARCLGITAMLCLAGCGQRAPQPAQTVQESHTPDSQQAAVQEADAAWAPPPASDFQPGSLQLALSGAVETELRLPVLATYDPNSDFARFSLDSAEGAPVNFSLVITGWSPLQDQGLQEFRWSGAQVEEGNPQVEALLFLDYQDETWRAEELVITLDLREEQAAGTIVEAAMRASAQGPVVRISSGAFDAPLRRLPLLEVDQEMGSE